MKRPSFETECAHRRRVAPIDVFGTATYPHEPLMVGRTDTELRVRFGPRWNETSFVFLDETNDDAQFRLVTCACRHCGGMYTFTEDV